MSEVTVFGTSWCGFCHQLKSWLANQNIEFSYIDVELDREAAREIIEATKQMGVPVIKIGDKYIVGFDRPKLEKLLSPRG